MTALYIGAQTALVLAIGCGLAVLAGILEAALDLITSRRRGKRSIY